MKTVTLLILSFSSIFGFAGFIEILHPSPKISDYCQKPACEMQAKDILVGASEDYFGNLIPWLGGVFILVILTLVVTIIIKGNPKILVIEAVLLLDIIIYLILNRFIHPFSRWPSPTWTVITLVLIMSVIFTLLIRKRKKSVT